MKNVAKTKEQLIKELEVLQQRVAELKKREGEHKQVEKALRQSEERLQTLIEESPVIICNTDLKGKVTYVNKKFEEVSGYSRGEMVGRSWLGFDVFPKKSKNFLIKRMGEKLTGRPLSPVETQFKRKTGEWIWVLGIGELVKKHGKPIGLQIIAQDITELKRAEEQLRESEERYRTVFENTGTATAIVEEDMAISLINQEFERHSGYSKEEVEGKKRWTEFADKDDVERMKEYHYQRRINPKAAPTQYEFRFIDRQGNVKDVFLTIDMIPGTRKSVASLLDITKRRRAEEALQESEASYRELADSITDVFFAMDTDLRCTYWNQASEKLTGISATDAIGKSLYELFPTAKGAEMGKMYLEALRTRQPRSLVTKHQLRGEHFFEITAYPSRYGLSIFIKDITEHKRAEEVLRGSEEKLRLMFESLAEGIMVTDLDGNIVQVNEATVHMCGYDGKGELIGQSIFELIASKDHARAMENLEKTLGEKYNGKIEYTFLRRDGSEFPAELSVTILKDISGKPIGFINIATGITERKRAEEALRESEKRYHLLAENAADVIWTVDMNMQLTYISPSVARLLGYSVEEAMAKKMEEVFTRASFEVAMKALAEELAIENMEQKDLARSRTLELELNCKDGSTVPVEVKYSFLRAPDGQPVEILAIARDITERKRMQAQLIITDRLASIGELAAGVAHELNNPLTSVIGFAQLIQEKDIPDDVKEDVSIISSEARRTAEVVKNLLTFARKHASVKQLVNANSIIEKVLELRAYEERVSNIQVNTRFAPDLPEVMADYLQLQQVFLNIIINAEHFMIEAHSKGTLTITTERADNIIKASFADDGSGIARENLGHLFDPFFTTKEVGKGTGLGLSICHGIITEHGGRIYAESEVGKGATFTVELPISDHG